MEIFIIVGLILLNGILSMSEIALVSARKARLELEAKRGNKSAQTALKLAGEPDRFLSTIQIGITLIGILTGLYSGEAFAYNLAEVVRHVPVLEPYALGLSKTVIVIIVTYLTLIMGELVPKRIGMGYAERVSMLVARPMFLLSKLALPFVWLLSKSTSFVIKITGIKANEENKVTEEEIKAIVKEGFDGGEVQEVEQDIVERVFNLGDRNVGSIMTHRSDLVWLDVTDSIEKIREKVQENLFNIYPVASEKFDNIKGVVYLKDLFGRIDEPDFSLEQVIRPAQYLPENQSVYNALEQFKQARVKYGIVTDEFGGIQGIVTLKDIMEGLIGQVPEIGEEAEITQRADGSWLVDGQYNFYDFLEYFDLEDLYAEHDYNTLSGLILEILERVPKTGETLTWLNFEFEIVDMDGARIDKVLVKKID
ncbi:MULTISPECIES: hemolysin family protein [Parabacteroides]|jgi:putative hemolysin|uniref:hemolysin family protein n=1 Tax=Parabacteroides TaxID=375288 RepID=UPI000EFF4B86|nr:MULTISPECIES: hemolysin family protein [Parabacteroides]RHU27305.1 HlyC/CorC family transporter [Parabacteroides sp. TM07-1AC]WFE84377.1 hemolysin family protein [Parabacteroides chongii]